MKLDFGSWKKVKEMERKKSKKISFPTQNSNLKCLLSEKSPRFRVARVVAFSNFFLSLPIVFFIYCKVLRKKENSN